MGTGRLCAGHGPLEVRGELRRRRLSGRLRVHAMSHGQIINGCVPNRGQGASRYPYLAISHHLVRLSGELLTGPPAPAPASQKDGGRMPSARSSDEIILRSTNPRHGGGDGHLAPVVLFEMKT